MTSRRIDWSALRRAVRGPGMDTREWVVMGRVDEDEDATVWNDALGWLCDVTALTGGHAGSTLPLPCRIASVFQGADHGIHCPPRQGGLCLVLFPSGDPNEDAVIVGFLHNLDDAGAPAEVNGATIVETDASSGQVAADETFIAVIPDHDIDIEARSVRVVGDIVLGAADADQPVPRGNDMADSLENLTDAMVTAITAVNTAIPTGISDPSAVATLQTAVAAFGQARQNYLSSRIVVK